MKGSRTSFILVIFASVTLQIYTATFEDEMKARIRQTETLLNDYKAFVESVDNHEVSLINKLTKNNNTFKTKTNSNVDTYGKKFDEYLTSKRKYLDEYVTKTWDLTEDHAAAKEKTLPSYNKMVNFNLTEAYWHQKVDNKYWRTNTFSNYIKTLNQLLASIEAHSFEAMKTSVENLKGGQMTAEELKLRKEKVDVLKAEFFKLAQYAASTQFHEEEKQRTEGQSGIKQIRTSKGMFIVCNCRSFKK